MDLDGQRVALHAPLGGPALGDRGEDLQQRCRLLAGLLVLGALLLVDQPRAVEPQRQPALGVGLLGEKHPAHVGVLDDRHLRAGAVTGDGPALRALGGVLDRLQVCGVAQGRGGQADADPGLVHHVEHVDQPAVLLADEVADRAGLAAGRELAFAEPEHRVDRAPRAHLVVYAGEDHVVALGGVAVVVEQEARNDEEADPLHAGRPAGNLGQDQVDDVLPHLVVAATDPHLGPEDPVAAVLLGLGARGYVGQRAARLGLGQAHRSEEPALDDRLDPGLLLLVGTPGEQEVGGRRGQQRVAGGGNVGGVEPGEGGGGDHRRQLHAADLLAHSGPDQSGLPQRLERRLDLGRQHDLAVLADVGLLRVGRAVMGSELLGRDLLGQAEDVVVELARLALEALAPGELVGAQPVVKEELDVPAGEEGACGLRSGHAHSMPRRARGDSKAAVTNPT